MDPDPDHGGSLSLFHRKQVIKTSQTEKNQGFSNIFCLLLEGSRSGPGSEPVITNPDSDRGGQNLTDLTDPDPQHWNKTYHGSLVRALESRFD